jgi:outer membrane protein TolC
VREQLSVGRIGSLLDALDASDRLYQARIRVTQALSEQMLAQAQLLKHMRQLAGVTDYAKLTVQ